MKLRLIGRVVEIPPTLLLLLMWAVTTYLPSPLSVDLWPDVWPVAVPFSLVRRAALVVFKWQRPVVLVDYEPLNEPE